MLFKSNQGLNPSPNLRICKQQFHLRECFPDQVSNKQLNQDCMRT
ncbi:unnamed protein product, partial [Vitis vinifera]